MFDIVLKIIILLSVTLPNFSPLSIDTFKVFEIKSFYFYVIILFIASLKSMHMRNLPDDVSRFFKVIIYVLFFNVLIHGSKPLVMSYMTHYFFIMLFCYLVIQYCYDVEGIIKFIFIGFLFNLALYFFESKFFNPIFFIMDNPPETMGKLFSVLFYEKGSVPSAMMGNFVRLTTYFAIILPFIWAYNFHLAVITLIISLQTYIQPQKIVLYSFFVNFFSSKANKKIKIIFVFLSLFAIVFYNQCFIESINVRISGWGGYIKPLFKFWYGPLIACGIGARPFAEKFHDAVICSSHLQFFLNVGILSILIYYNFLKMFLKRCYPEALSVSVFIIFTISFVEYPFEIKRFWPLLATIFSLWIIRTNKIKNQRSTFIDLRSTL